MYDEAPSYIMTNTSEIVTFLQKHFPDLPKSNLPILTNIPTISAFVIEECSCPLSIARRYTDGFCDVCSGSEPQIRGTIPKVIDEILFESSDDESY